jgi:outer membrane lipoprotein SlyB
MKEVDFMMIRKSIVLLMVAIFTLGVVGLSFSAQEVKGTVSKIEGNKLTLLDDTGKQITVQVKDRESLKEVKVGDRVSVKDGKVIKEST